MKLIKYLGGSFPAPFGKVSEHQPEIRQQFTKSVIQEHSYMYSGHRLHPKPAAPDIPMRIAFCKDCLYNTAESEKKSKFNRDILTM